MILSFYEEIANVSLKSQRFDLLSADRFLAEVQQIIGKTTVAAGWRASATAPLLPAQESYGRTNL